MRVLTLSLQYTKRSTHISNTIARAGVLSGGVSGIAAPCRSQLGSNGIAAFICRPGRAVAVAGRSDGPDRNSEL